MKGAQRRCKQPHPDQRPPHCRGMQQAGLRAREWVRCIPDTGAVHACGTVAGDGAFLAYRCGGSAGFFIEWTGFPVSPSWL
jgi:hypothetical protein